MDFTSIANAVPEYIIVKRKDQKVERHAKMNFILRDHKPFIQIKRLSNNNVSEIDISMSVLAFISFKETTVLKLFRSKNDTQSYELENNLTMKTCVDTINAQLINFNKTKPRKTSINKLRKGSMEIKFGANIPILDIPKDEDLPVFERVIPDPLPFRPDQLYFRDDENLEPHLLQTLKLQEESKHLGGVEIELINDDLKYITIVQHQQNLWIKSVKNRPDNPVPFFTGDMIRSMNKSDVSSLLEFTEHCKASEITMRISRLPKGKVIAPNEEIKRIIEENYHTNCFSIENEEFMITSLNELDFSDEDNKTAIMAIIESNQPYYVIIQPKFFIRTLGTTRKYSTR